MEDLYIPWCVWQEEHSNCKDERQGSHNPNGHSPSLKEPLIAKRCEETEKNAEIESGSSDGSQPAPLVTGTHFSNVQYRRHVDEPTFWSVMLHHSTEMPYVQIHHCPLIELMCKNFTATLLL